MTQAELVFSRLQKLPDSVCAEVFDFLEFLEQKKASSDIQAMQIQLRQPGSAQGQIQIADDFDAPLSDFGDFQ